MSKLHVDFWYRKPPKDLKLESGRVVLVMFDLESSLTSIVIY